MKQAGPSKPERIAMVALPVLCVAGTIIFAVWHASFFSIFFAVFATMLIAISILRSRKVDEREMMRRQDKAMATKDDPSEMARWVP
jgi:hypothetical protein